MQENKMKFVTVVRDLDADPTYKFAEIKYGRIVSIINHWVPLEEFVKFFDAGAYFIDITDVTVDGECPVVGDIVDGNTIRHVKSIFTPSELLAYKIEQMKLVRNNMELEPIEYKGVLLDADSTSITRMDKARKVLEDTGEVDILWTAYDNSHIRLTAEDFKQINILLAVRSTQLHDRYNRIKNLLTEAFLAEDIKYLAVINNAEWNMDIDAGIDQLAKFYDELDTKEYEKTDEYLTVSGNHNPEAYIISEVTTIDDIPDDQKDEARKLWGGEVNPDFTEE